MAKAKPKRCSSNRCPHEPLPGRKLCQNCTDYYRAYKRQQRAERKAQGVCAECGQRKTDGYRCPSCREALNENRAAS